MTTKIPMIGRRFGYLTVSARAGDVKNGAKTTPAWLCTCDCGAERIVAGTELRRDRITTCHRRHGTSSSVMSQTHHAMKQRCFYPGHKDYASYGGRGITVCDRWLNGAGCKSGLDCFIADMGPKPSPAHTLDRIDVDGPYSPDNCRWADVTTQARNRRTTRTIVIDGQAVPLAVAAEHAGLPYSVLLDRIDRYGLPVERALAQPLRRKKGTPVYKDQR